MIRKLMQRISIWLFRKSFNLRRVQAERLTNKKLKTRKEKKIMARFNVNEVENYGGQGGGGFFSLKNDKDVATVRFMYNMD